MRLFHLSSHSRVQVFALLGNPTTRSLLQKLTGAKVLRDMFYTRASFRYYNYIFNSSSSMGLASAPIAR